MHDACKQRGVALITVLCFLVVFTALATVASRSVGTHVRIAADQIDLETAFYTAEAGAERGAAHVANGGAIPYSFSGQLGDGTYYVTITGKTTAGDGSGTSVNGSVNINPNNSQSEFTLSLPSGATISRDDLTEDFDGYVGPATTVHLKPKGSGNQNTLTIDGESYPLQNGTTYDIVSSTMSVTLYNDNVNGNGKAMGQWYISIAATDATVTP
ncbi:MAG: hypothetical protein HN341_09515 [Verrucomicrobia bacterium]|nr:hypothetical protein [Verrucomicrobiota bacterium]